MTLMSTAMNDYEAYNGVANFQQFTDESRGSVRYLPSFSRRKGATLAGGGNEEDVAAELKGERENEKTAVKWLGTVDYRFIPKDEESEACERRCSSLRNSAAMILLPLTALCCWLLARGRYMQR